MTAFQSSNILSWDDHWWNMFYYFFIKQLPCFPKLISLKAKTGETLFGPIKPTNPSVRLPYKGQSSFGIIAILHTYLACKTLFGPIKPTNPSVLVAYKGQNSFGKPELPVVKIYCYTVTLCCNIWWMIFFLLTLVIYNVIRGTNMFLTRYYEHLDI